MSEKHQQTQSHAAAQAAKGRLVSLVIAGTMILWIAAQAVGKMLGLPGRYALLLDFAALAALFWALVVGLQIWRARNSGRGHE